MSDLRIEPLDRERPDDGTLLIVDGGTGTAVLIDPGDDPRSLLLAVEARGLRLTRLFATHLPDEERTESLLFWKRLGIPVHASAELPRELGFQPLMDGSSMRLGRLKLEFHHLGARSSGALGIMLFEILGNTARRIGFVTRGPRLVA